MSGPLPIRLTPRIVLDAWRNITRRQIGTTFLLGCVLTLLHTLWVGADGSTRLLVIHFVGDEIRAFALLLAVVAADCATGRDPDRRSVYALAVVVGAAAGIVLEEILGGIVFQLVLDWEGGPTPRVGFALYLYLELMLFGGGVVWVINDRRRAALGRARMHGAEIERIAAEKRSIESDLQAMQARVEPQFLFNTLAQVKQLYERDAPLGERMLDELIAYLRAAMPRMRDTSSTVGQEVELARAYLAIVKVRLGERFTYEIEASPAVAEMRMPPMMLLPLLDHALACVQTDSRAARSLCIRAGIADGRVRLAFTDSGDGFRPTSDNESIAGIRERLAALYRRDATLLLHQRDGGLTEAALELPLEAAARSAERTATVDAPTLSASRATIGGVRTKSTVQTGPDAPPTLPLPRPRPRERWFTGLTWKGLGLVALVCLINGVRRNILGLWHGDTLDIFLIDTVRMTGYGLIVAAPIVLALVATYNLAPRRPLLRYGSLAAAFLLSSFAGIAAWLVTEGAVECGGSCDGEPSPLAVSAVMGAWSKWGLLSALFAVVFVYLREGDESAARAQDAESARARFVQRMEEARLRTLQAQIEPHFLFNALATVRRLYQTDPADAATMLDNLMRYFTIALPQMRAADSTLGREAELTESYLGIQKIRMGRRLAFDIEIPAPLRDARLPPMMLLTLVENAIKHGLSPMPEGGTVNVSAATKDGELQVRVADSGGGFAKSSGGGTGLANIRARLSGMYGSAGRLALSANAPRGVVASIAVPLSTTRGFAGAA